MSRSKIPNVSDPSFARSYAAAWVNRPMERKYKVGDRVRCISAPGDYWHAPYNPISDYLVVGKVYDVRDTDYYPEYRFCPERILVATPFGSKNFPIVWFESAS